jgi:invasion protein IalB
MENQPKTFALNTRRTCRRLVCLTAAILALSVIPAAAQKAGAPAAAAAAPAAGAAPAAAAAGPASIASTWVKTCDTDKASKKELCIIEQEIRTDSGFFIASIGLRQVTGDKKISLMATVPLGMLLKPGLKAQVDGGTPISLVYGICDSHNCYGLADLDDSFVDSMKAGKAVLLTTFNQQAKGVNFTLPLAGFADALAGKGMDPVAFQKYQQQRASELKAKAGQARDALVKEQQQLSGSPAQ